MKNLYIIGARGMGRTLFSLLQAEPKKGKEYRIAGFLDDEVAALEGFKITRLL